MNDIRRAEDLLSDMLKTGVNYVQGIEFQTTLLRKYKDEARAMAMKAAQEKATAMAGHVGQKIGKALWIREDEGASRSFSSYTLAGADSNNMEFRETPEVRAHTLAFGLITITARVAVSFRLE